MDQNNKNKKEARIYGAGGHSQVIRAVLEESDYIITDVFDDKPSGKHHASKNVVPGAKDQLENFDKQGAPLIIAIGNNSERAEIAQLLGSECSYEKAIHPSAIIAKTAKIGKGTVVFAGAIVQPNTYIGEHVIINTGASVDHDNVVGNFAHISPKAALCGHVEVGEGSHVGVGALVIPKVKIGKWCTIGAGTVVLKDVPDYATVVGNPGKIIKVKNKNISDKQLPAIYDLAVIGSGISSSFTLLHFLDKLKDQKLASPLKIAVIEKHEDFYTGIPYGNRSGSSALLITSLADFLPEPELGKFIHWLNDNKVWLLKEFENDGGALIKNWIQENAVAIAQNEWDDLFLPRRFFGYYISEKVARKIEEARIEGLVSVHFLNMKVEDINKTASNYSIIGKKQTLNTKKVILAIGSPPTRQIWDKAFEKLTNKTKQLHLVSKPYEFGLNQTLVALESFLEKRKGLKNNVLIVGSNASALELLFKLNDNPALAKNITKFNFISTQGIIPDSVIDYEARKNFNPQNLKDLSQRTHLTAKEIADAVYSDLDIAEAMNIGAATTVSPISTAFGNLLNKLNKEELENFACNYGNEIGRRQRCAGQLYADTVTALEKNKRFDHIAGRFIEIVEKSDENYSFKYLDTVTKTEIIHDDPIHIIINCIGSQTLDQVKPNTLYSKLITKELCSPNNSLRGFEVNSRFETAPNFHLVGPLLAGNVIENKAVWHVEHCGRIIWLSKLLANILAKHVLKPSKKLNIVPHKVEIATPVPSNDKQNSILSIVTNKHANYDTITEKENWSVLLNTIGYYDFYHTYDYHIVAKLANETPLFFKYNEGDVIIGIPLLLRSIENTPYNDATSVYGYPGPVSKGVTAAFDNSKFIKTFHSFLEDSNIVSVFSRLNPFIPEQENILKNCGEIVSQGKVVNIDISQNPEIQRQNFQKRLKTHINKSRRNCSIRKVSTPEDLEKFISIYHENMGRVNAKKYYYFDDDYFKKMLKSKDFKSEILLAINNDTDEVIAGCIFIITNNIVQYHLSGTKNEFLDLMPTKLLIDEMRLKATELGLKFFNLGGGLGGLDDDSLFRFKSSFSKDFKDFKLWKLIVNEAVYSKLVLELNVKEDSGYFPLYRHIN